MLYDRAMKAFVCELDQHGLRRLTPEHLLSAEELGRLVRRAAPRPTAVVWALLEEPDAEDLRAEFGAGHHRDACGTLLNRAVELLPIGAVAAGTAETSH